MSNKRVLQVIAIATNALAEATSGPVDMEKIGGAIDILGMLEDKLARCGDGGEQGA